MFSNTLFIGIGPRVALMAIALFGGPASADAQEAFSNLNLKKTYLKAETSIVQLDGPIEAAFAPTSIYCPGTGTSECVLHVQFTLAHQDLTFLNGAVFVNGEQNVASTFFIQTTGVQFDAHTWSAVITDLAPGTHTIDIVVQANPEAYLRNRTLRIDVLK
jgi:hypothetical protein